MTVWGFVDGNSVLWLVPVNTADNFLHLALGLLGLAAGAATPKAAAPAASPGT